MRKQLNYRAAWEKQLASLCPLSLSLSLHYLPAARPSDPPVPVTWYPRNVLLKLFHCLPLLLHLTVFLVPQSCHLSLDVLFSTSDCPADPAHSSSNSASVYDQATAPALFAHFLLDFLLDFCQELNSDVR